MDQKALDRCRDIFTALLHRSAIYAGVYNDELGIAAAEAGAACLAEIERLKASG